MEFAAARGMLKLVTRQGARSSRVRMGVENGVERGYRKRIELNLGHLPRALKL